MLKDTDGYAKNNNMSKELYASMMNSTTRSAMRSERISFFFRSMRKAFKVYTNDYALLIPYTLLRITWVSLQAGVLSVALTLKMLGKVLWELLTILFRDKQTQVAKIDDIGSFWKEMWESIGNSIGAFIVIPIAVLSFTLSLILGPIMAFYFIPMLIRKEFKNGSV